MKGVETHGWFVLRLTLFVLINKRLCFSVESRLKQRTSSSLADKYRLEGKALSTMAFLLFSLVEVANQFLCLLSGTAGKLKIIRGKCQPKDSVYT